MLIPMSVFCAGAGPDAGFFDRLSKTSRSEPPWSLIWGNLLNAASCRTTFECVGRNPTGRVIALPRMQRDCEDALLAGRFASMPAHMNRRDFDKSRIPAWFRFGE